MTTPYPQPYAPPPVQKPRKMWPWIVVTAIVFLFIGVGIGGSGSRTTTTTAGATVSGAKVTAAPTAPAPAEAPSGPATSFGDGTWVVGEDIVPGTYKSTGARPGFIELCSVTTHAGAAGDGDVIKWETANAGEPVLINVTKAKSVKATGCETFQKV